MFRKKHTIYTVQYSSWFQASTGGWKVSPSDKGGLLYLWAIDNWTNPIRYSPFLRRTGLSLLDLEEVGPILLNPRMVVGGGSKHRCWEAPSLDLSRPDLLEGRVKSQGNLERGMLGIWRTEKEIHRDS